MAERGELLTLADDEAVLWHGAVPTRFEGLDPSTQIRIEGREVTTLPRRGELLSRIATVNDVHFGELEAGRFSDDQEIETFSVPEGAVPYPEVMSRAAVSDIGDRDPDLVVAKGDLTSAGSVVEYERFLEFYGCFGDSLLQVRGNHESYHRLAVAMEPTQERVLPGVTVALLDTSRDGIANGAIGVEQLDWLDELGQRSEQPVLVFGHHPVWNQADEERTDSTFGLLPDSTDALGKVFARRHTLSGYFAGHTHRNRVVELPGVPGVPFAEVACVKDYPGSWAEYRIFEGAILQIHRRIEGEDALAWTEKTRGMYGGSYVSYARGRLQDRCFEIPIRT